MNLDKVKEALKHIIDQPDEFMFTAKYLRCYFQEIIGEPDNPIDGDVLQVASRWVTLENNIESLAYDIQQYAESYHAKKCAECKNKRPHGCHDCGDTDCGPGAIYCELKNWKPVE